ncbi:hypothetical protein OCU04_003317 [Sclerotinia nivalis]|uniref:Uncharacterized protein n=1 Tax=Sclerotinia nivalis TaxID=352851 RepID=A0A9X0DN40_9HELO|nr:hypothetical protein OCU04_003317 [Sclerotinia nivalis]
MKVTSDIRRRNGYRQEYSWEHEMDHIRYTLAVTFLEKKDQLVGPRSQLRSEEHNNARTRYRKLLGIDDVRFNGAIYINYTPRK